MFMTNDKHVTDAWRHIHEDHPRAYRTSYPGFIGRLRKRDFQKTVDRQCHLTPHSLILEAGCGSGRDSLYFSRSNLRCVAVDYFMTPLNHLIMARSRYELKASHALESLMIAQGDIFSLPFRDNTFDLVFNSGVIEHYDRGTRRHLLKEMARTTRPTGFVCVRLPNRFHVLDPLWARLVSTFSDHDAYGIPEQAIPAEQIADEMSSVDLRHIYTDWTDVYDSVSLYPDWRPFRLVSFVANMILPRPPRLLRKRLGTRIIAIGQKQ